MNRNTKLSLMLASFAVAGSVAFAAQGEMRNDAKSITNAKISLIQAITTAEQHANGKAARAEYENSKHGWVYDVEVVSGIKVFDVKVDANKGTVIASTEDRADRDDEHDNQD